MARKKMTRAELQKRGMDALVAELGYPNAVEFILECSRRGGDYTKERRAIFAGTGAAAVDRVLAGSVRITTRERARSRRKSA